MVINVKIHSLCLFSVDQITGVFVKAIEDTDNNGDSITITMKGANTPSPDPRAKEDPQLTFVLLKYIGV